MQRLSLLIATLALLAASSCGWMGQRQSAEPIGLGSPERLLDVSSEVVNLGVHSGKEVDDLSQWVNRDQPTRAELYCQEGERNCREARQALDLYGVPVTFVPSAAGTVTLVYERVLARDCDQRYVDREDQWYNEHYQGWGCSVAGNMVQAVTQKQQFVSPNLSDYRDAESAVNGYTRYGHAVGSGISNAADQQKQGASSSLLTTQSQ